MLGIAHSSRSGAQWMFPFLIAIFVVSQETVHTLPIWMLLTRPISTTLGMPEKYPRKTQGISHAVRLPHIGSIRAGASHTSPPTLLA
jgi:hypothetical protein